MLAVAALAIGTSWTRTFVGNFCSREASGVTGHGDLRPMESLSHIPRQALDNEPNSEKKILVVSDSTGQTAVGVTERVLAQFVGKSEIPEITMVPQVKSLEKLSDLIRTAVQQCGPVLVVATLVDSTMAQWARTLCQENDLAFIDVMTPLLDEFSGFLDEPALGVPGGVNERKVSKMVNRDFFGMVEAVKFGQQHIAGLNAQDWGQADLILVGPSRVGKGPVAHYLAQRGVKCASINISPKDLLPAELEGVDPSKVAVLIVAEDRLMELRQSRLQEAERRNMPMLLDPDYASIQRVREDLEFTYRLLESFPSWDDPVDITFVSVEETTSIIFRRVVAARKRMQGS